MTTISDLIASSIRKLGTRSLGETADAEELQVGLKALQAMLLTLFPGTHLTDVLISANYTAGENERITASDDTVTVTIPATVTDATTGQTRAPRNGALVEVGGETPVRYIYIAELAAWMPLTSIALTDESPLGPEHDEGLSAMLAVRLAPDLQQPNVPQWVVAMAEAGRRLIRQRFRQPYTATTDPLLLNRFQRCGTTL